MVWKKVRKNGLTFLTFEGWKGVSCFVSTRHGGVSPPPYESLNLGMSSGDHREKVLKNRERFYEAFGINPSNVIIPQQIHGKEVLSFQSPFTSHQSPICDGLLTHTPDLILGVTIADCLAIFLFDPRKNVIGILHAGWRGVLNGIAGEAIQKMMREFGSKPEDCEILLSPSIGPCCYEVGEEVVEGFRNVGAIHELPLQERNGKVYLDLGEATEIQLSKIGVKKIHPSQEERICTSCHTEDFFSYRREGGKTGRMLE